MKTTKRQTLIGLGTLAVGSAFITSSGAFSSVQADRTVSLETTGDASASLGLEGQDPDIAGTEAVNGNQVLTIENTSVNERSLTTYEDALSVSNNSSNEINFYIDPASVQFQSNGGSTVTVLDFQVGGNSIVGEGNATTIGSGSAQEVTIIIDITADGIDGSTLDQITSVSFVATESAN